MTPAEREARLMAVRRMQDEIYRGIGATDRPDVDGRSRSNPRAEARGPAGGRGGTRVDIGPVTVDPPFARDMAPPAVSDEEREARDEFRQWQSDRAARNRARAAGEYPKLLNRMDN